MNCKNVQELLPLYVGADLEERHEKLVTAHVQSCAECATSADEYRKTLRLMEQYAPPFFGEAVYSGIRQRVLSEIQRESTAPALPQLVASFFRPRIAWAFATALLLAASVLAYYFIGNYTQEQRNEQQMVGNPGAQNDRSTIALAPNVVYTPVAPPALNPPRSPLNLTVKNRHPKTKRSAAVTLAPQSPVQPEPFLSSTSATSQRTLRVEMQTKDQNIRIIWFFTPNTNEGFPKESSKGI
jgi:hypothetical protein